MGYKFFAALPANVGRRNPDARGRLGYCHRLRFTPLTGLRNARIPTFFGVKIAGAARRKYTSR